MLRNSENDPLKLGACIDIPGLAVGVAVFDSADSLIYLNDYLQKLFPSIDSFDSFLGRPYIELLNALAENGEFAGEHVIQDPDAWTKEQAAHHKRDVSESTVRMSDGRWFEIKEQKLENGGVSATWTDVSLNEGHLAQLQSAMECIADGFAFWDQKGHLTRFNKQFYNRFSEPSREVKAGATLDSILSRAIKSGNLRTNAGEQDNLSKFLASRHIPQQSITLEFVDGQFFILSSRRTGEGGMVTALTDISELAQKERQLKVRGQSLEVANSELEMVNAALERQGNILAMMAEDINLAHSEVQLKSIQLSDTMAQQSSILNSMSDALVVLDEGGCVVSINAVAIKMFHIEDIEIIGQSLNEYASFTLNDENDASTESFFDVVIGCLKDQWTERWLHPNFGKLYPVNIAVSKLNCSHTFFIVNLHDISEKINTQRKLVLAAREAEVASMTKSHFLANMSHELRTPLNCVIGFSEVMTNQMFGPLTEQYRDYAGDINMSGQHLLTLIDDVLDVSKIELGEFKIVESQVDVSRLIETCLIMSEHRATQGSVIISKRIGSDLPALVCDEMRIKQSLLNILTNAIKFTKAGGDVLVIAQKSKDNGIELIVRDTGIGISSEFLGDVMKPFAQIDDVSGLNADGTGLGLAITKSYVELHNGDVKISSRVNVGTEVCLKFPPERSAF